jgi:predicted nucleic acid-binding protein
VKFADTSWWVAWALPGDGRHGDALDVLRHVGRGERILTTNGVVGETWTFLRRKDGHRAATAFLDRVESLEEQARLVVHRISAEQEGDAFRWLRRRDEREYSFVDATSFRVMHDRRLSDALAFDGDFAAAGFVELRP